jgi:alpha-tubulin suppressor-like RCC1 family protein
MPIGITSGYKNSLGEDIGEKLVPKSYLIDRYPELLDNFRFAGLWTWGYSNYGQLGENITTTRASPVQTISGGTNWKLISCGGYHTAAIKTDGTLWSWGRNQYGQIGNNTQVSVSSPVQTIAGGTNWKSISCGKFNISAIKTDGTLWSWGVNYLGQLGDNTALLRSSPVQTIAGGTNWKLVSSNSYHTAAIKTDGTLWTWGMNTSGQLGDNTIATKSSPIQTISAGTNWKLISVGYYYTAAIKTDGTLWTWGKNDYGQLGDNTVAHKSSPVQTIAGGTNWNLISAGNYHIAANKTDGTLWTWGYNGYGQLGDNTLTNNSSPVQTIAGGTNWKTFDCGDYYTTAIKTDGTLWGWGYNQFGQLGDNTNGAASHKSSPVQTISGGTNWKSVACGNYHTAAIRDDSEDLL